MTRRRSRPPGGAAPAAGEADFDAALTAARTGFPADPREAARHYRRPARVPHPDTAPPGRAREAARAFARLAAARARHQRPPAHLPARPFTMPAA